MKKRKSVYVPYGEEWEKSLMKIKKKDIIQMFRFVCKRRDEYEKLYLDLFDMTDKALSKAERPA